MVFLTFLLPGNETSTYMMNSLTKPMILVQQIASYLLVLNSSLNKFPKPENKSGDMIEIVLCMVTKDQITSMTKAGIGPRNMFYRTLIDHLATSGAINQTTSKSKTSGTSGGNNKKKENKPGKGKFNPNHNTQCKFKTGTQMSCDIINVKDHSRMLGRHMTPAGVRLKNTIGRSMNLDRTKCREILTESRIKRKALQ